MNLSQTQSAPGFYVIYTLQPKFGLGISVSTGTIIFCCVIPTHPEWSTRELAWSTAISPRQNRADRYCRRGGRALSSRTERVGVVCQRHWLTDQVTDDVDRQTTDSERGAQ